MKTVTVQVPVTMEAPPGQDDPRLRARVADVAQMAVSDVSLVVVRKRSLDVRRRRRPCWVLRCDVFGADERPAEGALPSVIQPRRLARPLSGFRPIIVGMGPAGLFAALTFADHGVRCLILDRGSPVEARNIHVRDLRRSGALNPESNLCFGEGGAGTYSDGKLYTRTRNDRVRDVYLRLVALGISSEILIDAHPHVGTNRLIPMMPKLRHALLEAGHELLFDVCVDDLLLGASTDPAHVVGVKASGGREFSGGPVLLATGHSARDTYEMLARHGVQMVRKPFAIGASVEHPQSLIDEAQLGSLAGHPHIGAAEYFVSQQVQTPSGRCGVYSFCMCPGGFVLPSPTWPEHLNVNGMSNAGRNSPFANAALVAQVGVDDLYDERPGDLDDDPRYGAHIADGALLGLALQSALERRAFAAGGGSYRAPAELLTDLISDRHSGVLPDKSSYRPGLTAAPLRQVLPSRIVDSLARGARQIDRRQVSGYASGEAVIIGVETTTSSPVRIVRGDDRQSVSHRGLYPCAEGAGYAGGIVSSAIDGMRSAEAMLAAHGVVYEQPVSGKR